MTIHQSTTPPAAAAPGTGPGTTPGTIRLPVYRNPVRMVLSASLWRSAWFLLAYLVVSGLYVGAVLTAVTVAAALAITLAGLPVIIAAAAVIRGCANAERWRLSAVLGERLRGGYQAIAAPASPASPASPGIIARARACWRDAPTWRDLGYLGGMFVPLFALDYTVIVIWLVLLGCITVPAWYWAPEQTFGHGGRAHGLQFGYFPNGPHGPGGVGLYVDTLPKALLAAAGSLILFLLFSYVVVITARTHARVARALLRPPADALAGAREILSRPGPLPALGGVSAGDAARSPGVPRPRHPGETAPAASPRPRRDRPPV